jgi:hypothetical protein
MDLMLNIPWFWISLLFVSHVGNVYKLGLRPGDFLHASYCLVVTDLD